MSTNLTREQRDDANNNKNNNNNNNNNGVELPVMRRVVVAKQLPKNSTSSATNAELRPPQRGNPSGRGPAQADVTC